MCHDPEYIDRLVQDADHFARKDDPESYRSLQQTLLELKQLGVSFNLPRAARLELVDPRTQENNPQRARLGFAS